MSDVFEFQCPECEETLQGTSEIIGEEVECPSCEMVFELQVEPEETPVNTGRKRGRKVALWTIGSLGFLLSLVLLLIYLGPLRGLGERIIYTTEARTAMAENEKAAKELEAKFQKIRETQERLQKNAEEMERKKRDSDAALKYEMERLQRDLGR